MTEYKQQQIATPNVDTAQSFLQSVIDTGREPFLVLSMDLRVVSANRAFFQAFSVKPDETMGRLVYELGSGQWNIPALRNLLEDVLTNSSEFEGYEVEYNFPDVGRKVMLLNGRKLYRPGNHTQMLLLAIDDVTARKQLDQTQLAVYEREHAIATRLQSALQPDIPTSAPGLGLAKYYKAALAEAEVGGDFYDLFPLDTGCTALVVGDVSGKGLEAAAQIAMVRNMLRAFLYLKSSLAEAVFNLNHVLADNALLEGFTTLFVGAYEGDNRLLRYVNCGQEPALIRRADTGEIEQLAPTGGLLGALMGMHYHEAEVTLFSGDALAVFTDGLTEVGPNRREMLEVDGISDLFSRPLPEAMASADLPDYFAVSLMQGAEQFARGGVIRDDVCLLVAVAE